MYIKTLVLGGGVVGLSSAYVILAKQKEPKHLVLIEKEKYIGSHSSARNSEVIHAGLYYKNGSKKAEMCVRGRRLLYRYLDHRNINHRRCGKWVIATTSEEEIKLHELLTNGHINDVEGLSLLTPAQVQAEETWLRCEGGALYSVHTGIVDSHHLMKSLRRDIVDFGGDIITQHEVYKVEARAQGGFIVWVKHSEDDSFRIECDQLINATGLWGGMWWNHLGEHSAHQLYTRYALGRYWQLQGKSPTNRLIYPLPEAGGLGIHLTIDLQGRARFGPDVKWLNITSADQLGSTLDYSVPWDSREHFVETITQYWPRLPVASLIPDYAGMRVKVRRDDQTMNDFQLLGPHQHGVEGLVHLLGIESPGLTSALAIGDWVSQQLR
jgi:L-2-hydroxyglutarate oxidase LhgO